MCCCSIERSSWEAFFKIVFFKCNLLNAQLPYRCHQCNGQVQFNELNAHQFQCKNRLATCKFPKCGYRTQLSKLKFHEMCCNVYFSGIREMNSSLFINKQTDLNMFDRNIEDFYILCSTCSYILMAVPVSGVKGSEGFVFTSITFEVRNYRFCNLLTSK